MITHNAQKMSDFLNYIIWLVIIDLSCNVFWPLVLMCLYLYLVFGWEIITFLTNCWHHSLFSFREWSCGNNIFITTRWIHEFILVIMIAITLWQTEIVFSWYFEPLEKHLRKLLLSLKAHEITVVFIWNLSKDLLC